MKAIIYYFGNFLYRFMLKSRKETIRKLSLKKYDIDKSVSFWHNTFITGDGNISIGKKTYIGQQTYISANPSGSKLKIGKNCAISHNVQIRTGTYDISKFIEGKRIMTFKNIEVGNNVWIGANSFITGGVKLGDNVIVGAHSFVNKSFGNNLVIAGIPAKILKKL